MTKSPSRPGALSRRRFLAATSAALLPMPALAQAQYAGDVDVAIVGGGAAGIAAARKLAEAGRNYVLLEAGAALGGRARTVDAFGQKVDLGASGFARTGSTLAAAVQAAGGEITALPSGRRLFVEGREANESAYDAFSVALGKARRDMLAVADANKDPAAATVIGPVDGWAATAAQLIGPLGAGRALASLSTLDLVQREAPPDDVTSMGGIGALIETLGSRLNVQTNAAVSVITNAGRFHTLTLRGQRAPIRARAIIVAVPAPVIAAGAIRFNPVLPARLATAFRGVPAGFLEQVAFRLPRNPLGLQPNETVLARAGTAPPALLRGRVNGGDVHVLTFGDAQAREIAEKGEAAALNLVRTYLATAFELDAGEVSEVVCSRWGTDPLFRGALVAASPGQGAQRRVFADPVQVRIFLAGDYVPTRGWGTLAAAWSSGEAAAAKALRLVGDGPA